MRFIKRVLVARKLREIRRLAEQTIDPDHKATNQALLLIMTAAHIGCDIDDLARFTHLDSVFVESVSQQMLSAGLWKAAAVDYSEWELGKTNRQMSYIFWLHAGVALGKVFRKPNEHDGFTYWNEENQVLWEWAPGLKVEWPGTVQHT